MDINFEKLYYYFGGVVFLLILGTVYYFIRGKKMVEEELKKRLEEQEEARIGEGGNGLYTLCPTAPTDDPNAPSIEITDADGELQSKINTVPPRVIYTNCPKNEAGWVEARRDMVIQMIVADGGEPFT